MIDLSTMTVVVADDIESMCKSIRGMMKVLRYGKKFFLVHNGADALKIIQQEEIDLLIVDWNMPIMNGVELLERIREDEDLRDMPVIMVTAQANRDMVAEAGESEIDAYLLKPLTVKSLCDKIEAVVDKANNPPPMFYHLKKARTYREAGDLDAAISEAQLAMTADRMSSRPHREIGALYFLKNDYNTAEKWLLKASQMNHYDVFAAHLLGEIYLIRNDIDRATEYFEKAMQVSPRHVGRGISFGKALIQKKLVSKALKVFDKTFELSNNDMELKEEVAFFCTDHQVYKYAVKLFESILIKDPGRNDILIHLGNVMEQKGDIKKAIKYLTKADKNEPNNTDIKIRLAKNYIAIGQMVRADKALKAALVINPKNRRAKNLLKQCV
jgi:CheY-like chemotaxis protein/Tfp pilus assembly protein PilF